jgi:hypothetical protein
MASNGNSSHVNNCANVYKLGTSILGNPSGAKLVDLGIVVLGPVRCFKSKCNTTPGDHDSCKGAKRVRVSADQGKAARE